MLTQLVEPGVITLERAVELMTLAPAKILSLEAGVIREGGPADITVFDPKAEWVVDPESSESLSRNTPFGGMTLRGQVRTTLCRGNVVFSRREGVSAR